MDFTKVVKENLWNFEENCNPRKQTNFSENLNSFSEIFTKKSTTLGNDKENILMINFGFSSSHNAIIEINHNMRIEYPTIY